ncbi:MAG: TPM domain-containing protein [Alphaproteobacteria bacterium]
MELNHRRAGAPCPTHGKIALAVFFGATLILTSAALALELPPLGSSINDFAGMIPPPSLQDLDQRLLRFKARTGYTVVVLTLSSLGDARLRDVERYAFENLPLDEKNRRKTILLVVARKERRVGVQPGSELQTLFPEPAADQKLQAHVSLYFDGFRPDLGIYSGVNYIFRAITGDVRVESTTDEEKLENSSIAGRGAGAIFTLCLAPYLALVVGLLWGLYATKYRVQCVTRVFIGAVLGSGTAKLIAVFMSALGSYGYDLWTFILASSILLGSAGSYTEFWMQGDWCAIPRVKDRVKRKPEDNMGI